MKLTLLSLLLIAGSASASEIYVCSYWNNAGWGTVLSSDLGVRHQVYIEGAGYSRKPKLEIVNVNESDFKVTSKRFVDLSGGNVGAGHLNFTGSDEPSSTDYKVTIRLALDPSENRIDAVVIGRQSKVFINGLPQAASYSICFKSDKAIH